jgi:hypothetical protein
MVFDVFAALRKIKSHKIYAFTNIAGFTICISSCILLFKYVNFEFSFDKIHDNSYTSPIKNIEILYANNKN